MTPVQNKFIQILNKLVTKYFLALHTTCLSTHLFPHLHINIHVTDQKGAVYIYNSSIFQT